MIACRDLDVLVLTHEPEPHRAGIRALRSQGMRVRTTRDAVRACALLSDPPALVIADLGSAALFTKELVRSLNAARGRCHVLALHWGILDEREGELAQLVVDGLAPAHAWLPALCAEVGRRDEARPLLH